MANTAVDYGPSGKKKTTYNTANLLKVSNSPALAAAQRSAAPTSGASSFGSAFGNAANVALNTARNVANSVGLQTSTPKNTGSGFGGALSNAANTVANTIRNVASSYIPTNTTPTNTTPENTSDGDGGTTPTYNGDGGSSSGGSTGGGSSSGSSRKKVSTDFDSAPVYDATAVYQRYLDNLRQQAENAYNSNMGSIQRAYDYQSGVLQSERDRARQELQNRYNEGLANNLAALEKAYNAQNESLTNNYGETTDTLGRTYNSSLSDINNDAENSLRQAYINRMLSERNLGQELSALGLNGGAAESTIASLLNNYGNARNEIITGQNKSRSNLYDTYMNNLSDALKQYNDARATLAANRASAEASAREKLSNAYQSGLTNAEESYRNALQNLLQNKLSLENSAQSARQNLLADFATNLSSLATTDSTYLDALRSMADNAGLNRTVLGGTAYDNMVGGNSGYTNALGELVSNQREFSFDPTQATNTYEGATVRQGSGLMTPGEAGNAYARYLQQAQMMRDGGQSDDEIKNYLFSTVGNNANALSQIFAQLGLV